MPGTFSKAARPVLPGAYFNWVAQTLSQVPASVGSIVCVPFTSDWGPNNTPTLIQSFQQYLAVFGPTIATPGYNAVWQAFQGEGGYEGRYGAGAVLAYRIVGSAGASASHAFTNTTPATAITLSAKYPGSYGNNITVTTQDHAADTTFNEMLIFVNGIKVETYVYLDTLISSLVSQINALSSWVTATQQITGVALTIVSAVALTGGNDGSTVTGSDYTALENALATQQFGILAPYALTDNTIIPGLYAWAGGGSDYQTGLNAQGKRFTTVLGGAADESAASAVTAAAAILGGDFCRLGMGHVIDSLLLDANGNAQSLSMAQLAPRLAGVLAARGETMSLTGARFPGLTLVNGAIPSDKLTTLNGGVMVLDQDSDPIAPVFLLAARTTFTKGAPSGVAADANFPYLIYRNPKFMRTMQNVETEFTQWATQTLIGKLPVNNKTRDAAIAEMQRRLKLREAAGIIQTGWNVDVDQNPPATSADEFIAIAIALLFGRSVEQAYFTVTVG